MTTIPKIIEMFTNLRGGTPKREMASAKPNMLTQGLYTLERI
jgi:hypothetical protein